MIIDPHIAVIRIPLSAGPDFYEAVMRRVAGRDERPQGIMMHFTAPREDEFLVWTVFRDSDTMLEGFVAFSSLEAQNEMVERGVPVDMTRDEFPLERLHVDPSVETQPFGAVPAGGIVATISDQYELTLDQYRRFTAVGDNYDKPLPGRIAHLAYNQGGQVIAIDFWSDREIATSYYRDQLRPTFEELMPGVNTERLREASWLDLHSFVVAPEATTLSRHFLRETSGPTTV